jgi:CheY-like chemotaxis protein
MPALQLLVVDDNRDAADAMVMAAQVLGHEAVAVYDGTAALSLLQTFRPDLMILDLSMPGMDGYALATAIRARQEFRDTLLVALSGFGAEGDRQRSLQSGFDLHMLKPMEIDTLEHLLLRVQRQPGRSAGEHLQHSRSGS